ncbi:unnamed protein product, partial [Phaeothamnion confervicola]
LRFAAVSAATFFALTVLFYVLYGDEFLQAALLHHFGRADHRHNYSIYWYWFYLDYEEGAGAAITATAAADSAAVVAMAGSMSLRQAAAIAAFAPQVVLLGAAAAAFGRDHLPFCLFVQTLLFVANNKVCTGQYFSWYLALLPAVLPALAVPPRRLAAALTSWLAALAGWLWFAYRLEMLGAGGGGAYRALWLASLAFYAANVALL